MGKEHDVAGASPIITASQAAQAALLALQLGAARPRVQVAGAIEPPGVPPGARSVYNPNAGVGWGAPLRERVSAEGTSRGKAAPGAAAQESSSAWGRQVTITQSPNPIGAVRVFLEKSESFTLSVDVLQEAPAGIHPPHANTALFVWAQITFGNGGTSIQRNIRCDYRIDAPIAGSYVDVLMYLAGSDGETLYNGQFTNNPTAIAVVQLSRGIRGLPYSASIFHGALGATQLDPALDVPARLMSVAAHLGAPSTGGTDRYLQLFDTTTTAPPGTPGISTIPKHEYALGAHPIDTTIGAQGAGRLVQPSGFVNGVWWGISTTSGQYTASTDEAWVEIESMLL